jgi:hypothetical protein
MQELRLQGVALGWHELECLVSKLHCCTHLRVTVGCCKKTIEVLADCLQGCTLPSQQEQHLTSASGHQQPLLVPLELIHQVPRTPGSCCR